MARKPRFALVGVPQHVIQRGNNREPCFHGAEDCQRYLGDLRDAAGRNHCRVHAYVLMTNHVHLLVTPMAQTQTRVREELSLNISNNSSLTRIFALAGAVPVRRRALPP